MGLDLIELHRVGDIAMLIEFLAQSREIWVIRNPSNIASEKRDIDLIEADQRCEQPSVGFGQLTTHQIGVAF